MFLFTLLRWGVVRAITIGLVHVAAGRNVTFTHLLSVLQLATHVPLWRCRLATIATHSY